MHKHVTHNRCHATFADFSGAILTFLREEVPRTRRLYCGAVSDNFRVISPTDFRFVFAVQNFPCRATANKAIQGGEQGT